MFDCDCFCWRRRRSEYHKTGPLPEPFSLPAPLPHWPQGEGFAAGKICLGELEVAKITEFDSVWSGKTKNTTFYKPVGIPDGFFCLGHYCQSNDQPLRGYVLVAREVNSEKFSDLRGLEKPLSYTLVCNGTTGFIWLPNPPIGYRATGFLVTDTPNEPSLDDIRCVRVDLTENIESCDLLFETSSSFRKSSFCVWNTRPCGRGMLGRGVSVGTFVCSTNKIDREDVLSIACLKNVDSSLHAMPNLDQVHALVKDYGPTVYFHPDEIFLPSSVDWFFDNGAVLYTTGGENDGERIDPKGSLLPKGGMNDGDFWIDLPKGDEDKRKCLKCGNLESAELYVHVKPALGGSFTDIAMWIFCPFNGPSTLKVGLANISLSKVGEHVGDWEHFTLRVSNFDGELWSIYFSEHSGGEWIDASNLEYISGNKAIVYSSKHGHSSYPHPGTYIMGSSKLRVGVKNDVAKSKFFIDSSTKYKIVSAKYLGDNVVEEPHWLEYMREWGPTIMYNGRSEVEKIIDHLPFFLRFSVENVMDMFPTELYGEEGPTGPKEKDNWVGDERW